MKSFPSISTTSEIPVEKLCIGENYYIKTDGFSNSLSYGKIVESNDYFVCVENQRVVLGTHAPVNKYLKTEHVFSTFQGIYATLQLGLNMCFAVSPLNHEIAVGMTTNIVSIMKLVSGELVANLGDKCSHFITPCTCTNNNYTISCICYSPNNKYLAAGSTDGNMYIWDNFRKELLHKVRTVFYFINSIAFNSNNDTIVMHSISRPSAHMWSMAKKDFTGSLAINKYTPAQLSNDPCNQLKNLISDDIFMNAVTFSPDGSIIAMISHVNPFVSMIALWKIVGDTFILLNIKDYGDFYTSIEFNPSRNQLMLLCENGTISILNAISLKLDSIITAPSMIHSAKYSPSGDYIIASGLGRSLRVYNSENNELVVDFKGDTLENYDEEYDEDYDGIVSAVFDKEETKIIVCFPFYVREIPWTFPNFIPDEFKTQLIADGISLGRDLPDNAKLLICEYLHGVAVLI